MTAYCSPQNKVRISRFLQIANRFAIFLGNPGEACAISEPCGQRLMKIRRSHFDFHKTLFPPPSRAAIREICLYAHFSLPIQIPLIAAFRPVGEILKIVISLRPVGSGLHPASRAISFLRSPAGTNRVKAFQNAGKCGRRPGVPPTFP